MPKFKLESKGDISITLEFESDQSTDSFFKSHMLKDAIVELIYSADVGGWVKHEDTELQPDDFFIAILRAVVDSYRNELPFDSDNISDIELLRQLWDTPEEPGND